MSAPVVVTERVRAARERVRAGEHYVNHMTPPPTHPGPFVCPLSGTLPAPGDPVPFFGAFLNQGRSGDSAVARLSASSSFLGEPWPLELVSLALDLGELPSGARAESSHRWLSKFQARKRRAPGASTLLMMGSYRCHCHLVA
jgi:hypothetical protein